MNQWRFDITESGIADLKKLNSQVKKRIEEKLRWFVENFNSITPIALHEPLKGFFKFRVGDWRVIYDFEREKNLITIYVIDGRDKVYKKLK